MSALRWQPSLEHILQARKVEVFGRNQFKADLGPKPAEFGQIGQPWYNSTMRGRLRPLRWASTTLRCTTKRIFEQHKLLDKAISKISAMPRFSEHVWRQRRNISPPDASRPSVAGRFEKGNFRGSGRRHGQTLSAQSWHLSLQRRMCAAYICDSCYDGDLVRTEAEEER